jgi:hypothetical protein
MRSDAQKALRRTGVGASVRRGPEPELRPYMTRCELYQIKRGEAPEIPENMATRFGLAPSHQPRSVPARPAA